MARGQNRLSPSQERRAEARKSKQDAYRLVHMDRSKSGQYEIGMEAKVRNDHESSSPQGIKPIVAFHSAPAVPWYERNLFWGPVSIAISLLSIFIASVTSDSRWLLLGVWVCLSWAWLIGSRGIVSTRKKQVLLFVGGAWALAIVLSGVSHTFIPKSPLSGLVDTVVRGLSPKIPTASENADAVVTRLGTTNSRDDHSPLHGPSKPERPNDSPRSGVPSGFVFHDKAPEYYTILGMGASTIRLGAEMLRHKWDGFADVDGHRPLTLYTQDGELRVDATITDSSGNVTVRLENGGSDVSVLPALWDRNFATNELEIVDERQVPVFQMILRRPSVVELHAIFFGTQGSVISFRPSKRLFKYPSWEHPGEREDSEPIK